MREVIDLTEIARKMRGPDGAGRVLVLDVDYSSTKHHVYLRERASRHAYYLRPPEGMTAYDLERILDEAGGESELEFRYYVYPELHTDLKPVLTADPYAEKHFARSDERRFLQIEGERPKAREAIAKLLDGLKQPFDAGTFPRINEFVLKSFKPAAHEGHAEAVLLRSDGNRNELRRSEPGFHIAVAEHGFAKEIDVHRPTLSETEPVIILSSNDHTSESGQRFLTDLVTYFGGPIYAEQSSLAAAEPEQTEKEGAHATGFVLHAARIPRIEPPKLDGNQLLARAATAMKEQLPGMKLLRNREATGNGPHIVIRFPGVLGFGKGPTEQEIKELQSIYRATKGDPSFGSDWHAHYQIDSKTGEVRVLTSFDARPAIGWTALEHRATTR
jgi:hypothetical protein